MGNAYSVSVKNSSKKFFVLDVSAYPIIQANIERHIINKRNITKGDSSG